MTITCNSNQVIRNAEVNKDETYCCSCDDKRPSKMYTMFVTLLVASCVEAYLTNEQ